MQAVQGFLPDVDFTVPDPTVIQGRFVTVPSLGGYSVDTATEQLREAGFLPTTGSYVDSSYPYGTVAYTSPGGGSSLGTGSSVTIYISDGTPAPPPPPPGGNGNGNGNGGGGGPGGGNGPGNGGGGGNGNGGGNGGGGGGGRR
jgi:hypothetical protein